MSSATPISLKGPPVTIVRAKTSLLAGSTTGEDEVSGTITIPEVSHELEEDEFQVHQLSPP